MKKAMLLTFIMTIFCVCGVYAGNLEKPQKIYTQEEIKEKIDKSEMLGFTDLFFAEKEDKPMAIAVKEADSALYYDQLTPYEKELYDFFAENAQNYKNGTGISDEETGSYYRKTFTIPVKLGPGETLSDSNWQAKAEESMGISIPTLLTRAGYTYFYMDHPEIFWVDLNNVGYAYGHGIDSSSNSVILAIELRPNGCASFFPVCYTTREQVEADDRAIQDRVDELISALPYKASDFYKVKYFSEWLCAHNSYNTPATVEDENGKPSYYAHPSMRYAYIAPSALLYGDGSDKEKYPVCEGYSEALKILCDRAGVEAMCLTSTTHKWNAVRLGGKFYFCDPTWCDSSGKNTLQQYSYLLIGTKKMQELDKGIDHKLVYQTELYPPSFSANMYIEDMEFPIYSQYTYDFYKYLDVDNNNIIDVNDASELLKQAANIKTHSAQDMTGDGKLDLLDPIKYNRLIFQ